MPEEPVCLLGDLHGRVDLLERFLTLRRRHFPEHRLISLGDAIDRGEDSADVLRLLRAESDQGAVCLMGNHEEMLIEFLDDPADQGRRWLAHGGLATLASLGLRGLPADAAERLATREALRERLGAETEAWLRALPPLWRSGNLLAAHAGADPDLPPERQERRHLVWGHRDFHRHPRGDGICVAHGHVVVERAHMRAGRLALDTGAYATGRLSYALIDPAAAEGERLTFAIVPR
ncbi:metallophosphoesterase [Amaricoccus solimangrovi]|nr:metallophosphoesterase [Amaricoccus solimangrovi]